MTESQSLNLRAAAADCIIEIVAKRMDPTAKINLVQELKIVPACAAWSANLATSPSAIRSAHHAAATSAAAANGVTANGNGVSVDEDDELMIKYAKLLATLAGEVMDSLKRVENSEFGGKCWGVKPCHTG